MAYDQFENGLWIANESTGSLNLVTLAGAPIRSINLLAFGLTADGFADGVAVDGNRLLVTDFQGDLNLHDDIIMDINRTTGALNNFWNVDGPMNPNPNANMNTVLGIAVGAGGTFWVSTNDGQIHNVNLMAAGQWSRNSVGPVPGGGSAAEIDYDPCLNQYFMTNFQLNRHQHHNGPNTALLASFPGSAPSQTAITSNNQGTVWVSGFGDNIIYRHEGIPCNTASVAGSAPAQISWIPMTPNPFSGSTRLEFNVTRSDSDTNVGVYDTHGRLVRTLVQGILPAGPHAVVWDGRDHLGQTMPSGQYFYDLRLQGKVLASGKVLLIR
jgi:hypothetical protein